MSLSHFTLPAEQDRLNAVIQEIDALPLPALPELTAVPRQEAAWAWRSTAVLHLARQTPQRGRFMIAAPQAGATIPAQLLHAAEEQAADWGLRRIIGYTQMNEAEILHKNGYVPAGKLSLLQADRVLPLPAPPVPEGYFYMRFTDFNHLPTLAALLNRSFADRFGRAENEHKAVTVETIQANLDAPDGESVRLGFSLLLNFFGKGVAVVRSHPNGWIESPGVVPEERHQDLHILLLAQTLQNLRPGPVNLLSHDDDAAWLEAYQSAGFKVRHTWIGFHKDL